MNMHGLNVRRLCGRGTLGWRTMNVRRLRSGPSLGGVVDRCRALGHLHRLGVSRIRHGVVRGRSRVGDSLLRGLLGVNKPAPGEVPDSGNRMRVSGSSKGCSTSDACASERGGCANVRHSLLPSANGVGQSSSASHW
jgi:hypothetical protein